SSGCAGVLSYSFLLIQPVHLRPPGSGATAFAAILVDSPSRSRGTRRRLERVKGIEPSSSAWKAVALPLSYTRFQMTGIGDQGSELPCLSFRCLIPVF